MKVSKFIRLSLSPPARRANSVVMAAFLASFWLPRLAVFSSSQLRRQRAREEVRPESCRRFSSSSRRRAASWASSWGS